MKVAAMRDTTHNPFNETHWVSCLRENLTSSSYGEGLETGRAMTQVSRQSFTRQNEHCNVHKNHGYELEQNYGHGQQTLSGVFYLLNLLAFIAPMILERGDRLYQRCVATTSRRELWHTLRTAMRMILVSAWADFLLISLDESPPGP